MFARNDNPKRSRDRLAFTLVELLMVIMLIGILASFVLVALAGVNESAKEDRTRAQIMKIHELLMERWEQYRYRRVPVINPQLVTHRKNPVLMEAAGLKSPNLIIAFDRLEAVRELMRLEFPTQIGEVIGQQKGARTRLRDSNSRRLSTPALSRGYFQRAAVATGGDVSLWSADFESAECLYLILSQIRDADSSALDFFRENEIGDVDGDGMKEILDAWGTPIYFLRWAPGFVSPVQQPLAEKEIQDDMFDPMRLGGSPAFPNRGAYDPSYTGPRELYPLIFSAGPDGQYGIVMNIEGQDTWYFVRSNPYAPEMRSIGSPTDPDVVNKKMDDNITNHFLMQ